MPSRIAVFLWLLTCGAVAATLPPAVELKIKGLAAVGDHRGVARLLETWLNDHPEDAVARLRQGRAYLDSGDRDRAESVWRRLLKRVSDRPELYRKIGEHAQRAGLYDLAVDILEQGARELGGEPFSWPLSELYIQMEDWPKAVASLLDYGRQTANGYALAENRLQALARSDDSVQKSRSAGMLAALEAAASHWRESTTSGGSENAVSQVASGGPVTSNGGPHGDLHRAADPLQISLLLSSFALEVGQPRLGLAALSAVDHLPNAAGALFQFASRSEAQGHDDVAVAAYERFARLATDSPIRDRSALRQAAIEKRSGRYRAALKTYQGVVDRAPLQPREARRRSARPAQRPEVAEALLLIGRLQLENLEDPAAARVALEALLGVGAGTAAIEAEILLVECYLREDDLDRAGQRLASVLTIAGEQTALARFSLAEISFFQGNFDGAIAHLDSFLNEQPRHASANDALALLLIVEDHQWQPEALAMFALARLRERQVRPAEAAVAWQWLENNGSDELREQSLLTRAKLREREMMLQGARTLYELMASRFPEGRHALEARLGRARLLARQGQAAEALKAYEASLLHFPDDARAPRVRLRIQELREQIPERGRG